MNVDVVAEHIGGVVMEAPDFEKIKQVDPYQNEWWSARDLAPLLGYSQWRRFADAIERAKLSCLTSGHVIDDHFVGAGKMITVGKGGQRAIEDYKLSRLACYLIAQNGDPRKEAIAAAQLFFAVSTRENQLAQLYQQEQERLDARMRVSESYKSLASSAARAGVPSGSMGLFMDAGNLGLYRRTLEELRALKGIGPEEEYLDRIGRQELSAIDFKNTLTDGRLKTDAVQGEERAITYHYNTGDIVRRAIIEAQQPPPEALPTEPSIKKLVQDRRRQTKKKKGSQNQPPIDEQERLF